MWSQDKKPRETKFKRKKKLRGENLGGLFLCTLTYVVL